MSIVNFNDYAPYYVDGERRAEEEMANQQQWMDAEEEARAIIEAGRVSEIVEHIGIWLVEQCIDGELPSADDMQERLTEALADDHAAGVQTSATYLRRQIRRVVEDRRLSDGEARAEIGRVCDVDFHAPRAGRDH